MNVGEFLDKKDAIPCENCERFGGCKLFKKYFGLSYCAILEKIEYSIHVDLALDLLSKKILLVFSNNVFEYEPIWKIVKSFADEINKELKP